MLQVFVDPWLTAGAYGAVVALAARKGRAFGVFAAVVLGFATYVVLSLGPVLPGGALLGIAHALACAHVGALVLRPTMRPPWFRWGVSIPGLWLGAASLLALPWAVAASLGMPLVGGWVPFAVAALGVGQSLFTREETVSIRLDRPAPPGLTRHAEGYGTRSERPLRLVQITDPHLGPFMSVARLQAICRRAVARSPDLIVLTGDLMTMESQDVAVVSEALRPLREARGRVFACHGNHDHEARQVVAAAYAANSIQLLDDDATLVSTPAGRVQLVGLDFTWQGRQAHVDSVLARHPRHEGALRLVLLHDPGAFRCIRDGDADLVLSGHTHGGQVGLLSLGLRGTVLSLLTKIPDHGLWSKGRNRLYVHRAQGHYGYPIRLGVPAEQSLLEVYSGR